MTNEQAAKAISSLGVADYPDCTPFTFVGCELPNGENQEAAT
ncbi:hypothetical protein BME24068_02916 [Burkholderia metallica]|nr:hypothetical protein BME24068_02916 [Burkholderia metallica]